MNKEKVIRSQIEVGDRVTYIETFKTIGEYKGFRAGFKIEEIKRQIVEIVMRSDRQYRDILKVERIGQNGFYTVYEKKEEILDEKEKTYLNAVIKPFKKDIEYIAKITSPLLDDGKYLRIVLKGDNVGALPDFKPGTMYKNMELEKRYTLKELGLE